MNTLTKSQLGRRMLRFGDRSLSVRMARRYSRLTSSAGFTLVELMVSIALGLIVLAGLVTMFANTSVARGEIDKASRQIENGRYALHVLTDDIAHAGYFGPLSTAPTSATVPDPCLTASTTDGANGNGLGVPIQGYAGASADPTLPTGCLLGYKANTAVLVVRRAGTTTSGGAAITANEFNIQVSGCAGEAAYIVGTALTDFTLHKNDNHCPLPLSATSGAADIWPLYVRIYYITTCSNQTDCTASGADTVPTLRRVDVKPGGSVVTPIVDGIENLQIQYGLDSTGDGSTDSYTNTPPTTAAAWQDVVALRVYLLSRNNDATGGYVDTKTYAMGPVSVTPGGAFKRHAYNEVVRINNVAGRRE